MKYTANGLVEHISETQNFPSGFSKRAIVLSLGSERYPQSVPFEVFKDQCNELDKFRTRENVQIEFVLNGREYDGRYFVNLRALKITSLDQRDGVEPDRSQPPQDATTSAEDPLDDEDIGF